MNAIKYIFQVIVATLLLSVVVGWHFAIFIISSFAIYTVAIMLRFDLTLKRATNDALTNILLIIVNSIIVATFFIVIASFLGILIPIPIEILNFLRYGEFVSLSINDLLLHLHINNLHLNNFNIENWKGIERISNWFFFDLNASLAFIAIFVIDLILVNALLKWYKQIKNETK